MNLILLRCHIIDVPGVLENNVLKNRHSDRISWHVTENFDNKVNVSVFQDMSKAFDNLGLGKYHIINGLSLLINF